VPLRTPGELKKTKKETIYLSGLISNFFKKFGTKAESTKGTYYI
jgi:hypothetical protein